MSEPSPFVTPRERRSIERSGVRFFYRALTAEEVMPLARFATVEANQVQLGAEGLRMAMRTGFLGWSGEDVPEWSDNIEDNLDVLTLDAYMEIAESIVRDSMLTGEQRGNSDWRSPSAPPDSSVADGPEDASNASPASLSG